LNQSTHCSVTNSRSSRRALDHWAYENGVSLNFIQPGKPQQNACIESFNARLRQAVERFVVHLARGGAGLPGGLEKGV